MKYISSNVLITYEIKYFGIYRKKSKFYFILYFRRITLIKNYISFPDISRQLVLFSVFSGIIL